MDPPSLPTRAQVAWVSVDTQTILTIHNNVITRNPRISLSRPSPKQWHLHVHLHEPAKHGPGPPRDHARKL